MIHRFASVFVLPVLFASTLTTGQIASAPQPNPVLYLARTESVVTRGKRYIRYRYDVAYKDAYPAEMFAPAPQLPPCGANRKASRTRVDIYGQNGKRLYGFCDLARPSDLGHIWFILRQGVNPPSYVYIELTDRQTGIKYKSNLADTTL